MKTPPAATIRLGASWHYRCAVILFATLLVANYSISTSEKWPFFFQNSTLQYGQQWWDSAALLAVSVLAAGWALWDAWAPRPGALHYAAGDWVLARGDVEVLGTLRPVIDLPDYMLVRFTPQTDALALEHRVLRLHNQQQQWLHLERRHTRHIPTALLAGTVPAASAVPAAAMHAVRTAADSALSQAQWLAVRRAVHAGPVTPDLSAHEQV
jgi:hypothetical protein